MHHHHAIDVEERQQPQRVVSEFLHVVHLKRVGKNVPRTQCHTLQVFACMCIVTVVSMANVECVVQAEENRKASLSPHLWDPGGAAGERQQHIRVGVNWFKLERAIFTR